MRHNMRGRKLGRTSAHRKALFRNQLASLVLAERIKTTLPKAKELRPVAERIITRGRIDTVQARRLVRQWLPDRTLVRKVFEEISPRFIDRPGGYLRIVKLGPRQGDGAEMAILEFVEKAVDEVEDPKAKKAKTAKKEPKVKKDKKAEPAAAES